MYMMYIHDENSAVNGIGLWYPGNTEWAYYYFVKNLQGDVLEVYNEDYSCVASYSYDAWGNILTKSGSLADINPFRYRGYYFDNESWFYYLQSRYYDPAIGRFINADVLTSTGQGLLGNNMFAYCGNNPVMRQDPEGELWQAVLLGVATQYAADVLGNYFDGKTGAELFIPTSSLAEYTAAAVTSVIPGSGVGGALARSAISEGIMWIDNTLTGNPEKNDLKSAAIRILTNTAIDLAVGKTLDFYANTTSSKEFSTYARNAVSKGTSVNLSRTYNRMRYASKMDQILNDALSLAVDITICYVT